MRRRFIYGYPGAWGPMPHMMWMCGPGKWRGHDFTVHLGEEDLEALEELQRDLEQAAADVADQIRRIKERQTEKA